MEKVLDRDRDRGNGDFSNGEDMIFGNSFEGEAQCNKTRE